MKCGIFKNNKLYFGLAIMTVAAAVYPGYLGKIDLFAQTVPTVNNTAIQQHAEHSFDNLILSENIPLNGQLPEGDYILLMDFTPFATSIEG
ncbi:MAG: hypothetical protein ACRD5J_15910, partial [Nitrososphaeraceae archaeon]